MITGLAHLCFVVKDLDKSIAFYTEKLGLKPAFDFRTPEGQRYGIYLHVGGRCFIELFIGKLAGRAEGQTYQHLCLEVDDINATATALRAGGVEVTEVKMGSDHSWQAWLADPEGNRIELHQYTPESWQRPHLK